MKLRTKIFFFVILFFSVIFLFSGYSLLSSFNETAMEREIEAAVEKYQYNKFVIQSALITKGEEWFDGVADGAYDVSSIVSDMNDTVAFLNVNGSVLFSEFPRETELSELLTEAGKDRVTYRFAKINNRTYLLIAGIITQEKSSICLVTGVDVERVLEQQHQMIQKFGVVYAAAICAAILLIYILSLFLTRPIKELTEATNKIAEGNYQERITVKSEDEVGQLARHFNKMACAVEEKVQELSDNARQKEDFVANFSHELKNPLTSIIGYADRIYQKELPREEQKQAAWYIWNEGMRLEALALKLMDLAALDHKEIILQKMQADVLLYELVKDEQSLLKEKNIKLVCEAEQAYINVEYDLFKSLIMNLIDNSIKAGADQIAIRGCIDTDQYYVIQVEDNGCGIPEDEITRITEAFYMIDKSRSRKQHGAGVGLSLAKRIAEIHKSTLVFESDGSNGTTVSLRLNCERGEDNE